MKVRYIYSACVVIETEDTKILCDPWITQGIYDGSWFHFPPLKDDPIKIIGQVDYIYISHMQPDHYDSQFLRSYLKTYPNTKIIIGNTIPYFKQRMTLDGFSPLTVNELKIGNTKLLIVPNNGHKIFEIGTALAVVHDGLSVININDNPFDQKQVDTLLDFCNNNCTLALLQYVGTGSYPQTYIFNSDQELKNAGENKKQQFLNLFKQYFEALKPQRAMPFAGKYILGGTLSQLNLSRGMPDTTEVIAFNKEKIIVLEDGGKEYVDLKTLQSTNLRIEPYKREDIDNYLKNFPKIEYDYVKELKFKSNRILPILPLTIAAYNRAIRHSVLKSPYWFCIKTENVKGYICFEPYSDSGVLVKDNIADFFPNITIFIDERYYFGLLTRLYHWNNAEIGSQFYCHRIPDVYRRDAYAFLNYFQV